MRRAGWDLVLLWAIAFVLWALVAWGFFGVVRWLVGR
jgi:hypothetical protein